MWAGNCVSVSRLEKSDWNGTMGLMLWVLVTHLLYRNSENASQT